MIDTGRRLVYVDGEEISLTRKEFKLLVYFIRNRNHALTYERIYDAIWHEEYWSNNTTIFNHILKLRRKLGADDLFDSVHGVVIG